MTDQNNENAPLREELIRQAATMAGVPREEFDENANLDTLGLDSSDAVVLAMQIEEVIGGEVEVGIFLRMDTVAEAIDEIVRIYREEGPVPRRL